MLQPPRATVIEDTQRVIAGGGLSAYEKPSDDMAHDRHATGSFSQLFGGLFVEHLITKGRVVANQANTMTQPALDATNHEDVIHLQHENAIGLDALDS